MPISANFCGGGEFKGGGELRGYYGKYIISYVLSEDQNSRLLIDG